MLPVHDKVGIMKTFFSDIEKKFPFALSTLYIEHNTWLEDQ